MRYKKLLSDSASRLTDSASKISDSVSRSSDSSNAIVALLTGLAVGAVLGVLFAPSSGEETRNLIAERASGLGEDLKDKYQSARDKVVNSKDELVENVKSKASGLSQEFKNFKQEAGSDIEGQVKNAADNVNDAVQGA